MTNANDYAFQHTPETVNNTLTKREYFAAMAMQGMLANNWKGYANDNDGCEVLTQVACNFADALIEVLNKEGGN